MDFDLAKAPKRRRLGLFMQDWKNFGFQKNQRVRRLHTNFYRPHPPKRPVLIRQGQLNPPFKTGKRFLENFCD
jgi:hypothetical protein